MAKEFGVDKTTILRVLKIELGLIKICRKWVPHELTPKLLDDRSQGASDLMKALVALGPIKQNHVVTGDQSWIYLRNEATHMWAKPGTVAPVRVNKELGEFKLMLTVMFSRKGVLLVDFLPEGEKMNSEYITTVIVPALVAKIKETSPVRGANGWLIHLDNARVHTSAATSNELALRGFSRLPHPQYSPDLAPSDFALFGYLKTYLRTVKCETPDDLREATTTFLMSLPSDWFIGVWEEWFKRLMWVSENQGKYYPK